MLCGFIFVGIQATVISDIIVLYVLRERNFYRQKKYLNVKGKATLFKNNPVFSRKVRHHRLNTV